MKKNLLQIIKDNLSFTIIILAILVMFYFGFQLIWPVLTLEKINPEELSFDKIGSKFK